MSMFFQKKSNLRETKYIALSIEMSRLVKTDD